MRSAADSIRIFQRDLQEKMFDALGMSREEANHKFGFLLGAFEYGAPPHGGIAFGFDRLCAILGGSESIRDFIAFPKNNSGRDVMLDAPATIDEKQLQELSISIKKWLIYKFSKYRLLKMIYWYKFLSIAIFFIPVTSY